MVTINVTQADIDGGYQDNCTACPIAIAIQRATRRYDIHVERRALLTNGKLLCELPRKAQVFIERFDADGPEAVKPFCFKVSL